MSSRACRRAGLACAALWLLASALAFGGSAGAATPRAARHRRVAHRVSARRRRRPRPAGRRRPPRRETPSPAPAPVAPVAPAQVAAAPPLVTTGAAQSVTGASATVVGTIDGRGAPTTFSFEWGTSTGYGQTSSPAAVASDGGQPVAVSAPLTGLAPLTTYHVRLVASGCGGCATGTVDGADVTFTTGGYRNPVFAAGDMPDPAVLDDNGAHDDYWAFATGDRFPILHSTDLVDWTPAGTALAALPSWVVAHGDWHPWAPDVVQTPGACPGADRPGCYVMYYVGLSATTGANCVAVATSSSPQGPYADRGPLSNGTLDAEGRPVGCGDENGYGQIDPSQFVDPASGRRYLYVSEDFSCPAGSASCTAADSTLRPTISVIPLSADGLSATGPRTALFSGDPGGWEAAGASVPTVEGPMAIEHGGTYYVLYSGGGWRTDYAMGDATGPGPLGPFTKAGNPILTSTLAVSGPGGGDTPVTGPGGGQWLVYHGREGSPSNPRVLRIDPFGWIPQTGGPDAPTIGGPTDQPQPVVP